MENVFIYGIDTQLLVDILLSDGRVRYLHDIIEEDLHISYYTGPSGKKVAIIVSDSDTSNTAVKGILNKLGVPDLIPYIAPDREENSGE